MEVVAMEKVMGNGEIKTSEYLAGTMVILGLIAVGFAAGEEKGWALVGFCLVMLGFVWCAGLALTRFREQSRTSTNRKRVMELMSAVAGATVATNLVEKLRGKAKEVVALEKKLFLLEINGVGPNYGYTSEELEGMDDDQYEDILENTRRKLKKEFATAQGNWYQLYDAAALVDKEAVAIPELFRLGRRYKKFAK